MQKRKPLILALLLLGLLLAACGGTETEVTRIVEVEVAGETITEVVEVTRIVEGETITEQVEVTRVVEVEVPTGGELVTLTARCKANPPTEDGRCNNLLAAVVSANAQLEAAGDNRRIQLETIQDNKDWGPYITEFELASDAGEAPDIIVSGHEDIGAWATSGIIIPVTDMIGNYSELDDVIESLWTSTELKGDRWGVPQDAEARPFYFTKPLLLQVEGWDQARVDGLADAIASGEFTFEDMLDTAEAAVQQGVVDSGNGFWYRPKNGPDFLYYYTSAGGELTGESDALIFDKTAALAVYQMFESMTQERGITSPTRLDGDWGSWNTEVASAEKVLFWAGGTWQWADWAANYVVEGGQDFLFDNIGYSPIPAGTTGAPTTLTHPLVYMISSGSEYPDLAMQLLAAATTAEINTPYAVASGHLGVVNAQADYEPYTNDRWLSAVLPLLEYTTFLPNSPHWSAWSEAYYLGLSAVSSGDLSAEEAVDVVVDQLQNELGDNVEIRE
jgi:inositol-phosphate transport system substrate-binding protein